MYLQKTRIIKNEEKKKKNTSDIETFLLTAAIFF